MRRGRTVLRSAIVIRGAAVSVWKEIAARHSPGATLTSSTCPVSGVRTRTGCRNSVASARAAGIHRNPDDVEIPERSGRGRCDRGRIVLSAPGQDPSTEDHVQEDDRALPPCRVSLRTPTRRESNATSRRPSGRRPRL
jgi:hypothetical protein